MLICVLQCIALCVVYDKEEEMVSCLANKTKKKRIEITSFESRDRSQALLRNLFPDMVIHDAKYA